MPVLSKQKHIRLGVFPCLSSVALYIPLALHFDKGWKAFCYSVRRRVWGVTGVPTDAALLGTRAGSAFGYAYGMGPGLVRRSSIGRFQVHIWLYDFRSVGDNGSLAKTGGPIGLA
jgi:hypothetical protein